MCSLSKHHYFGTHLTPNCGLELTVHLVDKKKSSAWELASPAPRLSADSAQMLEWKFLGLQCDSLQNKRWGGGARVTDSLPPHFPHFSGLDGLSAAARPWAFRATGFVFIRQGTEGQQKSPHFPAKLSPCPGGIEVWDHTLCLFLVLLSDVQGLTFHACLKVYT